MSSIAKLNARVASIAVVMLAACALLFPQVALAQATVDWTNLGKANFEEINDGDSVASGANSVTINTQVVLDGDANDADFGQFYSTGPLSYFTGQISSFTGVLLYDTDSSIFDEGDYFESTYTFASAVDGLEFTLGHVDQFFGTTSMHDAVVIEYDTGDGVWRNLRTLGAFTLGSGVGTTTINGQLGFEGTSSTSGVTGTQGDIAVDFGSTTVERFRIRYHFGQDNPTDDVAGNIQYMALSDLSYIAPGADLSLTKQLIGSPPLSGGTATWRLTVTNSADSTLSTTGVVVNDTLPGGFTFSSASGDGSFNSATGDWTVGSLAIGESASITIQGTISSSSGTVITNTAEVTASSATDPDSTVNNGNTSEDDYDTSAFTVQTGRSPGIPPFLSCPAGRSIFDWDNISGWTAGSTNNSYAFSTFGNVNFALTNDGAYINSGTFGGQSPTVFNAFTGGNLPAEDSLTLLANQTSQAGEVEIVITMPRSFSGLQFTIFDVDFSSGQFADRVEVFGTNSAGGTVLPTLTNGNVNFVSGNEAFGDGGSDSDEGLGNVVVTFTDDVEVVTVRYGNHSTAPTDPGQQGIGIHDITVCDPFTTLSVTKFSSVISDPVNGTTNPKAIPGALVEYLITVSNTGSEPVDSGTIVVLDDGPADAKMCLISSASGPVVFAEPGGSTGLTYTFTSIGSGTDDLEFSSDDGTSFTYTPVADADGCDTSVTDFRLTPGGEMSGGTNFTLRVRYVVE